MKEQTNCPLCRFEGSTTLLQQHGNDPYLALLGKMNLSRIFKNAQVQYYLWNPSLEPNDLDRLCDLYREHIVSRRDW